MRVGVLGGLGPLVFFHLLLLRVHLARLMVLNHGGILILFLVLHLAGVRLLIKVDLAHTACLLVARSAVLATMVVAGMVLSVGVLLKLATHT